MTGPGWVYGMVLFLAAMERDAGRGEAQGFQPMRYAQQRTRVLIMDWLAWPVSEAP